MTDSKQRWSARSHPDPSAADALLHSAKPSHEAGPRRTVAQLLSSSKGFVATAGVSYLGMGLSLISAPILARELGPDGRGVLAAAFASVQLLSWLAFLGLPRALSVLYIRESQMPRAGVGLFALLGVASCAFSFLSADLIANGDDRISTGIRLASFVLLFTGFAQVGNDVALAQGRIWAWNSVRATSLILPSILYLVAFATNTLSLQSAFLATLLGAVLGTLGGLGLSITTLLQSVRSAVPWKFSLQYWCATAFDGLAGRIDQVLLAALVPASSLGVYAVALTCASASGVITQALNHLSFKKFLSNTPSDTTAPMKQTMFGVVASVISGCTVIAAVAVFGGPLFGPSFGSLVPVTTALVVFQLFNDQWQLRTYFDSARRRGKKLIVSSGSAFVILLGAVALLHFGSLLTAFSMACAIALFGFVRLCLRGIIREK